MAKKEKPGEFWGKVHYRHGNRTLCNRYGGGSLVTTSNKKKVTCKSCKSLLRYQARVKKQRHF